MGTEAHHRRGTARRGRSGLDEQRGRHEAHESAGPLQARQLLYARAASMPAECMLIGNLHADMPPSRNASLPPLGPRRLLLGDLRKLTAADRALVSRKNRLVQDTAPDHEVSESFFPLGSWQQTTPAAWDGFARLARNGVGSSLSSATNRIRRSGCETPATSGGPLQAAFHHLQEQQISDPAPGQTGNAACCRILFPDIAPVEVLGSHVHP